MELPISPGGLESQVAAINPAGTMVGVAYVNGWPPHAARWDRAGRFVDLGTLYPASSAPESRTADLNRSGIIVGNSSMSSGNPSHATLWDRAGRITDLGTLPGGPGSQARAVNDAGLIVGSSDTRAYPTTVHADLTVVIGH
ncbi:MAG TPA: hypothetical protein VEO01_13250 [Pseudonocardiaceae bacterium]|nr:hypothetical protein [Pseudonocardiaceae bacterium]